MPGLFLTYAIIEWIIRAVMLVVILRRRYHPAASAAWLMAIFFLPVLGLLLYVLLGDHQLGRRRKTLHRRHLENQKFKAPIDILNAHLVQASEHPNPSQQMVMRQAEGLGGMATVAGNHVELLGDGNETLNRLIEDVDAANHHVHMLFYIYANDETGRRVSDALLRAAKRGVTCRLLADYAGSLGFFRSDLPEKLRAGGVRVIAALPVASLRRRFARLDLRNHRKIVVIDGNLAYTGSQNMVNGDYGSKRAGAWVDIMGRFEGPIVNQLQSVFVEDWAFETEEELQSEVYFPLLAPKGDMLAQCVPTGPNYKSETFRKVLLTAINAAREKLVMTSPYIVLDEPTQVALSMAAQRGVEVHIVIPCKGDHPLVALAGKSFYHDLLEDGVHMHIFQKGMLHSKTLTVDDNFALLGTANLDLRSFFLNFEVNVVMYGQQITRQLRFAQTGYINDSTLLTYEEWCRRPWYRTYCESAAALFSPLL